MNKNSPPDSFLAHWNLIIERLKTIPLFVFQKNVPLFPITYHSTSKAILL